jgi:putative SOS response-associated peptidase YedK
MCGRLDQNHTAIDYIQALRWAGELGLRTQAAPSDNATPGTCRPLMRIVDDKLVLDDYFWGYRAAWAEGKLPVTINARLEKLTGRYWASLLHTGRAIVPADGWYEWTGEKGHKHPWHVHLKSGEPLFLAALVAPGEGRQLTPDAGFALVSADAEGGMVDIHDRRPISLSAQDALLWLDPGLSPQRAVQLARSMSLEPELFEWHPVAKDMRPPSVASADKPTSAARQTTATRQAPSNNTPPPTAQLELPL